VIFVEKVCVIGAGSTKYGKLEDSISDITIQASVGAIESAGIDPKEIKAGYISNVFGVADKQVHLGPVVMSNLGISERPSLSIESACGSGSVSFREAFANVAAGFYDVVGTLIIFSLIINSSPDAKSLSVIEPSDHQPALFLTQSGIEISFEGGGVLVVGFKPPGPTSINPEPIPAYVVS